MKLGYEKRETYIAGRLERWWETFVDIAGERFYREKECLTRDEARNFIKRARRLIGGGHGKRHDATGA